MNTHFDITMQEFAGIIDSRKDARFVVWGASSCARDFVRKLGRGNDYISYYVDKDESKWGGYTDGIEIESPRYMLEDSSVDAVIIATMYTKEVLETLRNGAFEGDVYVTAEMTNDTPLRVKAFEKYMDDVKAMLADDRSREVLWQVYMHEKELNFDFDDICEPDQYFVKDIVKVNPHAVFVDAGAYHGETVDEFIRFQNGEFDKVYAFEMSEDNYKVLNERKFDERVELLNFGLWDERTTCAYTPDETCSTLGVGELTAECITLDEVIGAGDVTFIKMDIEGAEMKALLGAEKCIKRCKPQLAICVYHKPDDIYELTKLIHEWLPEHKLYIRHHSHCIVETVLYAVVE